MPEQKITPYGAWKSPITSDLIVSEFVGLKEVALDGDEAYWVEARPSEGGRLVVVRRAPDGTIEDVTPQGFNVRTRVHEYGGAAFRVTDGTIYFSNYADQRLYRQERGGQPQAITPEMEYRYADAVLDKARGRLICVREDHTVEAREAVNVIAGVKVDGNEEGGEVLVVGNDFYSSPRISPDGMKLAWLTWHHPNMPWDGTELWVGEFSEDGSIGAMEKVAGGAEESVFQPEWSPDGVLHFISDRTGWWNLYRLHDGEVEALSKENDSFKEAEFGMPQWVFGVSTYGFLSPTRIVCTYGQRGAKYMAILDSESRKLETLDMPYTYISSVHVDNGKVAFIGASPTMFERVALYDVETQREEVLRKAANIEVDPGYISVPEAIEFPTEGGLTAHGFFYAPKNKDYSAQEGEKPPLLVFSHGGPTSFSSSALDLEIQFWTSRGIGVLDVNYGGSTGYGREYRQRLNGQWGIVDVDDCVNGARYLVERGDADPKRLAIRGGSAGGYTTLNALTFRNVFAAGASYFGISDLEAMALDTHKFESRYLDSMIGPYPERKDLYYERSAIHFTDQLSAPMILFQGLEDKVVPPNQAEMMVEALRKKGLPVAYVTYEGEQHGFRRAETIKHSLDSELYFYSRIFGFETAEAIEPVKIENL
jgi:dipeptidyl aminopeptidase/acylaminoacyl peptidase